MDPKELIAALGVLADPNASDEDKAAALDKLSAHFNSLLDGAEGAAETEGASEATEEPKKGEAETKEKSSEVGEPKKDEPEKDSALASAMATIATLTSRMSKLEKASAVGAAPRASKPTIIARVEPTPPKDHVTSMIEAAERNTLRNLSK